MPRRPGAAALLGLLAGLAPVAAGAPPSTGPAAAIPSGTPGPAAAIPAVAPEAIADHPGRLLEVGGGRLFVEIEGSGPPLVLLPDGPGLDHASFHPYLSALSPYATLVYLDPRGCGRSEARAPSGYTLGAMVEDLEGVRAALGFETVDLLGRGLGGTVAVLYAGSHPGRVRRLVLVGATPAPRSFLDAPGIAAAMTPAMRAACAALPANRYLSADGRLHERLKILAPLLFRRLTDRSFHAAFAERITTSADAHDAIVAALAAGGPGVPDLRAALGRLKAPLLIVAGRHDPTASVADAEAVLAAAPGARLEVFEESGAFPFAEQPVDFLKTVRGFLSGEGGATVRGFLSGEVGSGDGGATGREEGRTGAGGGI